MHVPHSNLKGNNIRTLWIASFSLLDKRKQPFTHIVVHHQLVLPNFEKVLSHMSISCEDGLCPTNFTISSQSLRSAIQAINFCYQNCKDIPHPFLSFAAKVSIFSVLFPDLLLLSPSFHVTLIRNALFPDQIYIFSFLTCFHKPTSSY